MMMNTCAQNTTEPAPVGGPVTSFALFVYKLLPPLPLRPGERRPSAVSRRSPFGLDDAAIFEPLQGRLL